MHSESCRFVARNNNGRTNTNGPAPTLPQLFVGNLAYSIDEDGLRLLFAQYGPVVRAKIVRERRGPPFMSKGFGFVTLQVDSCQYFLLYCATCTSGGIRIEN
eukprot:COSAG05_NODE_2651_length_2801_cov_28.578090_3_plen_102_part_00